MRTTDGDEDDRDAARTRRDGTERKEIHDDTVGSSREGTPAFSRVSGASFWTGVCLILTVHYSKIHKIHNDPCLNFFQKKLGVLKKTSSTWENKKYPVDFASILPRFFLSDFILT